MVLDFFDRVRSIYSYGVFCYGLYNVAGNQARLVLEQARESPVVDEVAVLDRLFFLRYHDRRLFMPRNARTVATLEGNDRDGTWYLLRADYPADAFGHQRQVLTGVQGHSTDGFCRECPVETVAAGSWQEMIDHCAAAGEDVTPRHAPDMRSTMGRIPRWNQLAKDGQWVFPAVQA